MFVRIESPNAWAESQIRMRLSSPMLTPSRTLGIFGRNFRGFMLSRNGTSNEHFGIAEYIQRKRVALKQFNASKFGMVKSRIVYSITARALLLLNDSLFANER